MLVSHKFVISGVCIILVIELSLYVCIHTTVRMFARLCFHQNYSRHFIYLY